MTFEAATEVVDPYLFKKKVEASGINVSVEEARPGYMMSRGYVPYSQNLVIISGEYDDVLEVMTRFLSMSPERAKLDIQEKLKDDHFGTSGDWFEADVQVHDPTGMVEDIKDLEIDVDIVKTQPGHVVISGDYDNVMRVLTDYLFMSGAEADTYMKPQKRLKMGESAGTYTHPTTCGVCGDQVTDYEYVDSMGTGEEIPTCKWCAEEDPERNSETRSRRLSSEYAHSDDHFSVREGTNFNKFIDQILVSEGHNRVLRKETDSPQRIRAARHQDRPLNKIRFGGK